MRFSNYAYMASWMETHGRGKAWNVIVLHDNNCTPDVCSCSPEFAVEKLTPENLMECVKLTREWVSTSKKRRN
jgi:hypothetical protein